MMIIFNVKGNWKCKTRSVQLFIMALSFWAIISFWTFKRVWIFNEHLNNKFDIVEKPQLNRILQWKISVKKEELKLKIMKMKSLSKCLCKIATDCKFLSQKRYSHAY